MSTALKHPTVPPSIAYADVKRCMLRGVVPFLQSSPGIGKSSIARQIAEEMNLQLIDLRLSQCAPEDLQGLPMKIEIDGVLKSAFLPFDVFPLETDQIPKGKNGWLLFLDEFNSATKSVQAAAYKLVLDRLVGNTKLHNACAVMAAGNLSTDRAIVTQLGTASQSRVAHILMEVNHQEWVAWANKKDIDFRVIGFMHFQPQKLHMFNPDHNDLTFACPRTWEFVSKLIKGETDLGPLRSLLSGVVSPGIAMEFVAFSEEYGKIPTMAAIINDPHGTPIPRELSTRWAITTMVSANTNATNAKDVVKFIARFRPEEQIIYYRAISSRDHTLRDIPEIAAELVKVMRFMHNT